MERKVRETKGERANSKRERERERERRKAREQIVRERMM